MRTQRSAALFLSALIAACTPAGQQATPELQADILVGSWVDDVVGNPELFTSLTAEPQRAGWIALHGNDLTGAISAFTEDDPSAALGKGRALLELSMLFDDLAHTGDLAWERTFATWSEKSTLPKGSALSYVAGLAALEQEDKEVAEAWFRLAAVASDPSVVRAAELVGSHVDPGQAIEGTELPALVLRYNQHARVRSSGQLDELLLHAHEPLVSELEERGDGRVLERRFYDPQLLRSVAVAYRVQAIQFLGNEQPVLGLAQPPEGADPLAALLFGPVASAKQLEPEAQRAVEAPGQLGASPAALAALGLEPDLPAADDPDWARAQVRLLDTKLDAWAAKAREGASPDGQALLDDLQLVPIFRSRALLAMGRRALRADHPWQALTFAQQALDVENSRGITPVNHPGLRAIIIEAQLRTGHTREALDAIQPLLEAYPALTGLDEVLGDLAILQGLDRYGDSKEN